MSLNVWSYLLNDELGSLGILLGNLFLLNSSGELLSEAVSREEILAIQCQAAHAQAQSDIRHVGLENAMDV